MHPYRKDIDGLRAIAVISVILFHFGVLPNGYLGVDVFFVISGYLITGIIYADAIESRFSIKQFYLRRIRRIIPLIVFVSLVSLVVGLLVMLPDDLENLSQSVVATNLFCNNVLQLITTRNYWDVVNEYKPLMHTWSLGVEEQFYLFFPLLFLIPGQRKVRWILPILCILTIVSILLFCIPGFSNADKFYLLPFRFFELSLGGICSIGADERRLSQGCSPVFIILLGCLLFAPLPAAHQHLLLILTVVVTAVILMTANGANKISVLALHNPVITGIGKISFSLYMWHQVALVYTRYVFTQHLTLASSIGILLAITVLSVLSYRFIEQPFRDKTRVNNTMLLWTVGFTSLVTICAALYIYERAGVVRDVPELEITKDHAQRNMHAQYNAAVNSQDKAFDASAKTKILVIGNSFARDWVNVLNQSSYKNQLDISYAPRLARTKDMLQKISGADYIFFSETDRQALRHYYRAFGVDTTKAWCVGTKNFGVNNGVFYNHWSDANHCLQRTKIDESFIDLNTRLKQEWGNKYVDLLGRVIDSDSSVPVFTPDCKFISQDCRHFTRAGAAYFARLLERDTTFILEHLSHCK